MHAERAKADTASAVLRVNVLQIVIDDGHRDHISDVLRILREISGAASGAQLHVRGILRQCQKAPENVNW
eukprot:1825551-Pleurochrysis_carterae.AAC.1